jgi:hypothetical protein
MKYLGEIAIVELDDEKNIRVSIKTYDGKLALRLERYDLEGFGATLPDALEDLIERIQEIPE